MVALNCSLSGAATREKKGNASVLLRSGLVAEWLTSGTSSMPAMRATTIVCVEQRGPTAPCSGRPQSRSCSTKLAMAKVPSLQGCVPSLTSSSVPTSTSSHMPSLWSLIISAARRNSEPISMLLSNSPPM